MLNLNTLHYPITLETLEQQAPAAFSELSTMKIVHRTMTLAWLNGLSTSPIGRGYADVEIDKEDAKHSYLKIRRYIPYQSKRERGRMVSHSMSERQRYDFFNNREQQRQKIKHAVKTERDKRQKKALDKIINALGFNYVKTVIDSLELTMQEAANDPVFKSKKPNSK